ncbi:MAG: hypothetical protein U9P14_09105 [Gemmatimonadota bacterium]|nr:hypothetical protein [Gemmatimonadota bacterium]
MRLANNGSFGLVKVAFAVVVALLVLSFTSCLRRQTVVRTSGEDDRPPAGRISLQEESPGDELTELVLPQVEQEKQQDYAFNKAENLFDVNLEGADLRSTLQSMCDMLSINLVMQPGVSDSLTLSLRDVTFYKFLEVALAGKDIEYRLEDNFLYLDALGLETRIFQLDYLNTTRRVQGRMNITGQAGGASGGMMPQSNTIMQTEATLNLWADIQNNLESIVLNKGLKLTPAMTASGSLSGYDEDTGHRLVIDPNSGIVQVTAGRKTLEQVESYIDAVVRSLQRQVLIEARFIEINLDSRHEAGLDWSAVPDLKSLRGALPGGEMVSQALSPQSREFQIGVANNDIRAVLTAMSRSGRVNVLQSPQVSALNNQPAVIRVARTETFFQRQETPGQPATATSPATQAVVNYIPIQQPTGVVVNLTPQISDDGEIIMSIRPSITTIASVAVSPDGLSTSPILDVRELDTVAKVRHGQTIILAGLIQERDLEVVKETPLLARLPLLGGMFKQTTKDKQKVELVILLTPYINYSRNIEQISGGEQMSRYRDITDQYNFSEGKFQ